MERGQRERGGEEIGKGRGEVSPDREEGEERKCRRNMRLRWMGSEAMGERGMERRERE